jgi:hypothetical protein
VNFAKSPHQLGMPFGFGDEQIDIDDVRGVQDRPGQPAAQCSGGVDRREAADIGARAIGYVVLEGGDRVSAGATLIDRRRDAGIDPGVIRRQAERRHPFEDMNVQIDPAGSHQFAGKVDNAAS